jgi:hypothetical protein
VRAAEREPWTVAPAVTFLDHTHRVDDRLAELFEVIIGTGLRRGEAPLRTDPSRRIAQSASRIRGESGFGVHPRASEEM